MLYGEFGPPDDATEKEKRAWLAWKNAPDDKKEEMLKQLEDVMKEVGRDV